MFSYLLSVETGANNIRMNANAKKGLPISKRFFHLQ